MNDFVPYSVFLGATGTGLGFVLSFISANWVFTYRGQQVLHQRVSNQGQRIDSFKLDVAEKYASVDHLREVEVRLIDEIKGLREDLKELTRAILKDRNHANSH